MPAATVTSKGQITIPKPVREALHLEAGDRVAFRVHDGIAIMEPETVDLRELFGSLPSQVSGVSVDDMNAAIAARGSAR